MKGLHPVAKAYIALVIAAGCAAIATSLVPWQSVDPVRFACYLTVAVLASGLKVILPGINGNMSVGYILILVSLGELSLAETMLMACAATAVQTFYAARRAPKPIQFGFNLSSVALAAFTAHAFYHSGLGARLEPYLLLKMGLTTVLYFLVNTMTVAIVVTLSDRRSLRKTWQECYFWSLPYYLLGAALASLISFLNVRVGWQASIIVLPLVYLIYRSYQLYLGRLEDQTKHAQEMASLHLRTIEALALAIEAKDDITRDHLQRVECYALEIGRELGLSEIELQALRAGSLLHDVGKLAVPEHIVAKPGKLTPEEFEKMMIHPVVGAEILELVRFPYPVVPIVRHHHEKWNGTGYPDGLVGTEIPLGARILAAVDCLDALTSDRHYRRALPLERAMEVVVSEAGKSYDPDIIAILQRRYRELEAKAQSHAKSATRLPQNVRKGGASVPAAGFEQSGVAPAELNTQPDFLGTIAAARQEVQSLIELSRELGSSLNLRETLSVLDFKLRRMIGYKAIAIYVLRDRCLVPEYVQGEDSHLFSTLRIPLHEGLSGWVAANDKPIVNGNPAVETGYLQDPARITNMRSALAVPLSGLNGPVGVLALYHVEKEAFSRDHLRVLISITSKVSRVVENTLKYEEAEISATTDGLTGLPNARSLFIHLDAEISRGHRSRTSLSVVVCDLDGFKQVNDRFGHMAGNQVLKLVAEGLRNCCRANDYVARMGGDEFVAVLPDITPDGLERKKLQFKEVARQAGLQVCGEDVLSVSVGLARYPQHGMNAEELLALADRQMYLEKESGRRRETVIFSEFCQELVQPLPN